MAGKCRKHHPICIHLLGINNRKRLKPHQIQTTEQKDMTGEPKSQLHLLSLRSQPSGSTTHHQGPVTAWGKDGTFPQAQPWEMNAVSPYQKKVPTQCKSLHHQNQKYQVTSSVVIPQNPSGVDWAATGKYGPPWAVCFFSTVCVYRLPTLILGKAYANTITAYADIAVLYTPTRSLRNSFPRQKPTWSLPHKIPTRSCRKLVANPHQIPIDGTLKSHASTPVWKAPKPSCCRKDWFMVALSWPQLED